MAVNYVNHNPEDQTRDRIARLTAVQRDLQSNIYSLLASDRAIVLQTVDNQITALQKRLHLPETLIERLTNEALAAERNNPGTSPEKKVVCVMLNDVYAVVNQLNEAKERTTPKVIPQTQMVVCPSDGETYSGHEVDLLRGSNNAHILDAVNLRAKLKKIEDLIK